MPDNKKDTSNEVSVESVEKAVKEADEKGYYGEATDPTPRENYTVAGVTSGKPTPETDDKSAAEAREAVANLPKRDK